MYLQITWRKKKEKVCGKSIIKKKLKGISRLMNPCDSNNYNCNDNYERQHQGERE